MTVGFRLLAACALCAAVLPSVGVSAATLRPRDECGADPELARTVARLRAAVARRDTSALLALLSPKVHLSFGGTRGHAELIREWKLDRQGPRSPLWRELDKILALGCAIDGDGASIPYLFGRLDEARDPFGTAVTARPVVNLRAAPHMSAPVRAVLRYEIVSVDAFGPEDGWTRVRTDAGLTGFVRTELLQASTHYRLILERQNGRWPITAFIAGD